MVVIYVRLYGIHENMYTRRGLVPWVLDIFTAAGQHPHALSIYMSADSDPTPAEVLEELKQAVFAE